MTMAGHSRREAWQIGVITCTPGVCGGDPCVAGTRLSAMTIGRIPWEAVQHHYPFSGLVETDHAACVAWVAGSVRFDVLALTERVEALTGQIRDACREGNTTAIAGLIGVLRALVATPIAGIGGSTDGR